MDDSISAGHIKEMIEAWASGWSAHDMAAVARVFTVDGIYEDVPTGTVNRGHEALKQFGEAIFLTAPDITYHVKHAIVEGDRASAEWVMSGMHTGDMEGFPPPRGARFRVHGASGFEVHGGAFSRCSDYWDIGSLLRQLSSTD